MQPNSVHIKTSVHYITKVIHVSISNNHQQARMCTAFVSNLQPTRLYYAAYNLICNLCIIKITQ